MKFVAVLATAVLLTGCAGANISNQVRESGEPGSNKMMRCIDFSTGNSKKFNEELKKFDGWKMVYASEYTTANKSASAAIMCFEKPL